MRHGTRGGYRRRRCRCEECRAWNAAAQAAYRRRRSERDGPGWRPNGWAAYNGRRAYVD